MTARMKDCYLRVDFAKALKTPNAHIYVKTLRERVFDELRLDEGTSENELYYREIFGEDPVKHFSVDQKYNLAHLNNEQAIGYRYLEERA
jgi:hypothetical protein